MDGAILAAVAVTGTSTVIRDAMSGHRVSMRHVMAIFLLGGFLFGVSEINRDIAKALATLIATTAVLVNGDVILRGSNQLINPLFNTHDFAPGNNSFGGGDFATGKPNG